MRALVVAIAVMVSGAAGACSPTDIKLTQYNWKKEGNFMRVVGELINNCPTPTKILLQAVFRMKSGEIVFVHEFAPASDREIAPGQPYAFGDFFTARDIQPQLMDMSAIAVR